MPDIESKPKRKNLKKKPLEQVGKAVSDVLAKEQEQAAQIRAEELSKANTALQVSLGKLATDANLPRFLGHVLTSIVQHLGEDSGSVWLNDTRLEKIVLLMNLENGTIEHYHETKHPGVSIEEHDNGRKKVRPKILANEIVLHDAQEIYTQPEWSPYREYYGERGILAILSVPMFVGDTFLGIYTIRAKRHEKFTSSQLELAKAFANQAALAIHVNHLSQKVSVEAAQAAVLEERNRIARDLHDTLAHGFTGVLLQLEAATQLQRKNPDKANECVDQAKKLAAKSLKKARQSVAALQIDPLIYQNFVAALKQLVRDTTCNSRIKIKIECDDTPRPLPADVGLQLYHIAQESLSNISRHSRAKNVLFSVCFSENFVTLTVEDDGIGFHPDHAEHSGGNGLKNMRFRCERMHGTFAAKRGKNGGSVITSKIPLARAL